LAGELIVSSGALWVAPGFVAALRDFADDLESRRKNETPKPLTPTMREFFANARPPATD
jgi:hypothetical protein